MEERAAHHLGDGSVSVSGGDCPDADRRRARRHREHKRYYAKTAFMYDPCPWTEDEDSLVMKHEVPDSELSKTIHRSLKSICNRRWRLNENKKNQNP